MAAGTEKSESALDMDIILWHCGTIEQVASRVHEGLTLPKPPHLNLSVEL